MAKKPDPFNPPSCPLCGGRPWHPSTGCPIFKDVPKDMPKKRQR